MHQIRLRQEADFCTPESVMRAMEGYGTAECSVARELRGDAQLFAELSNITPSSVDAYLEAVSAPPTAAPEPPPPTPPVVEVVEEPPTEPEPPVDPV